MEDARETRGRKIAASVKLEHKGPFWIVPSQSGDGTYIVDYDSRWPKCSCPDYETRQVRCKHLFAVEYTLRREIRGNANDQTVTQTETVAFVRSKSPVAQVNEILCKVLCHNLCVLVQSFFEFGIAAEFWNSGRLALAPEGPPSWAQGIPKRTPWSGPKKSGRGPGPAA